MLIQTSFVGKFQRGSHIRQLQQKYKMSHSTLKTNPYIVAQVFMIRMLIWQVKYGFVFDKV